ncbi:MAG TPA: hypothetical protein VH678_20530 [Xanthobacteraceae bacterium]|jgi:hypothetical protein
MTLLPFPPYAPDVSPFEDNESGVIQNVFPRADGYGPAPSLSVYSQALSATCRGYFYARNADGSVTLFAATATSLYKLNNTDFSWTNVSLSGGPYSSIPAGDQWQFAQFNNFVFAVQINVAPQVFDLTSSTAFANLGGSPPQARYIAVVNRFAVLSGLGSSTPYRIQWSGLNSTTTWTSGVNSSDFQDLPDGGIVRGVAGGETGLIMQDAAIRRMIYAPGSPVIFQIERVAQDKGIFAPLSLVRGGDKVFFCGNDGFQMVTPGAYPQFIGKERVDRSFFADVDSSNLQLMIGAYDPQATRIYWAYKSLAGSSGLFDKILVYDFVLDKWSLITGIMGEYIATLAKPGLTIENMDKLASGVISISGAANNGSNAIRLTLGSEVASWTYGLADAAHSAGQAGTTNLSNSSQNTIEVYGVMGTVEANGNWHFTVVDGTHIDLVGSTFTNAYVSGGMIGGAVDSIAFSLDSVSTNALAQLSVVNPAHQLCFNTGTPLEAILDTTEEALDAERRVRVKGLRVMSDAPTCYGSVGARETLQQTPTYSAEELINNKGLCIANISTRMARGRLHIPAGTIWSFAIGLDPLFASEGRR